MTLKKYFEFSLHKQDHVYVMKNVEDFTYSSCIQCEFYIFIEFFIN